MTQVQENPALAAVVQRLQGQFMERLDDVLGQVDATLAGIEGGEMPGPYLSELADKMHKVAGIAGTLGHGDLGGQAAEIENLIRRRTDPAELPETELLTAIERFCDQTDVVYAAA